MITKEMSCEQIASIPVNNVLGEGVIWHPQQQAVWWTDIEGQQLFRFKPEQSPENGRLTQWSVPERIGSFAFVDGKGSDNELIVAFASGLAYYNVDNGHIRWLDKPESDRPGNRFNDGRVDRYGHFWAGCMVEKGVEKGVENSAGLYRLDCNLQITQPLDGLQISNGLCWSPDGSIMYHADSAARQIHRYAYDEKTGQISDKQLFAETAEGIYPDGATVDAEGCVWSAQWGGRRIVRYHPNGEILSVLPVSVSQPSCVSFGGPNMDWLFITSASKELPKNVLEIQPDAGNLLIYSTNIQGLKECFFSPMINLP